MKFVIYKTTNLINGKIYVGYDTSNNPTYLGSGTLITRAIKKYGREYFSKEIIEYCKDHKHMCEREIFWIAELNARNIEIGYNVMIGGDGGFTSEMTQKGKKTMGPEKLHENAMKGHEGLGKEGRSERSRKAMETLGKEGRTAKALKAIQTLGKEGCVARVKKANETLGVEGRSARSSKSNYNTSPEKRSKRATAAAISKSKKNAITSKFLNSNPDAIAKLALIDRSIAGWVWEAARILEMNTAATLKWMKKFCPELYFTSYFSPRVAGRQSMINDRLKFLGDRNQI